VISLKTYKNIPLVEGWLDWLVEVKTSLPWWGSLLNLFNFPEGSAGWLDELFIFLEAKKSTNRTNKKDRLQRIPYVSCVSRFYELKTFLLHVGLRVLSKLILINKSACSINITLYEKQRYSDVSTCITHFFCICWMQ